MRKGMPRPNQPDAANPAMASLFQLGHQSGGVADPGRSASFSVMRFLIIFFVVVCCAGCAARHTESPSAAVPISLHQPEPANPQDWGPAYVPGMEFGPAEVHLSVAFGQAEAFLAKQPFAKQYAKRACSGGGGRFVDVHFALLSDPSGRTQGTVRVDTNSGDCAWVAIVNP
jgi:hypothetical protein